MSIGEIGRCKVGGKVVAMCFSICCKFVTGKTWGDSLPVVAASM